MTTPDVSIVIPCYNAERFVGQAIQSALDQGPNVEVIAVDDGSTDGSLEVIKSFDDRIRWQTGPNRGACAARNEGLAAATAPFVFFLDADDWLAAGGIRNAVAHCAGSNLDLLIGFIDFRDSRAPPTWQTIPYNSLMQVLDGWLSGRLRLGTGSFFWRREFLLEAGGWNNLLMQKQDLELFAWSIPKIKCFSKFDAIFLNHRLRHSSAQITARKDKECFQSHIHAIEYRMAPHESICDNVTLGKFAYFAARDAFRHHFEEEGERALALARLLGFAGHVGSTPHVLAANLLGLRRKERLAVRLRPPRAGRDASVAARGTALGGDSGGRSSTGNR